MPGTEKRHFHRVCHDARATLSQGMNTWPCVVEDLSLKGCMVRLDDGVVLDPDGAYRVDIHLSYAIHIEMEAMLAHQKGRQAGFYCTRIDSDSIAQLRRLVELNLGDSRLLERDMHVLLSAD